jgi:hypothetical protein
MALAGNDRRISPSEVQYGELVENWVSRIICKPAMGRWSADPEEILRIERREDSEKANCF